MQVATDAARGGEAVLDSVCSLAREVKARYEALPSALPIVACGVGTAGNVDKATGAIASANSLMPGWGGQPLRAALEAACGVPCAVLNDVQAHAMGELTFGAARGATDAIMIAVGTGIGGAIVAEGQVVLGARGFAGAFGTTPCAVAARMNESGAYANNGSIEAVASGSGIEAVYAALTGEQLSGHEIAACAHANEDARKAIQLAGTTLGEAIATWVKLLDPAVVVLGGSVAKAGELWRESVEAAYATNMAPAQGDSGSTFSAPIKDGELGGDAPLLGATAFALSKI
jgi:glucokinase